MRKYFEFTISKAVLGVAVALLLSALAGCRSDGVRFSNPHLDDQHGGFFAYLRMRLFGDDAWASVDPADPGVDYAQSQVPGDPAQLTATWVGHSTVLISYRGVHVLTDPIWAQRASPLSFAGPKRFTQPGLAFDELPPIDFVVISHNHYDHLDAQTVRRLGDGPRYLVPTGVERWFLEQGIAAEQVASFGWWDAQEFPVHGAENSSTKARTLRAQALPSQHFSGRGLWDRNETLWASWGLTIDGARIFFAGDTGYNDVQFRQIGERAGPFDLGVIPVGAYRPRSFMGAIHVDPAGAVAIHQDVRASYSLGVHWGAFLLTAEHPREVQAEFVAARDAAELTDDAFELWRIGETRVVPVRKLTPPRAAP
ncbi:MAG: MBL fold metallo-hydrolase [Pseudomonadota bacterium]